MSTTASAWRTRRRMRTVLQLQCRRNPAAAAAAACRPPPAAHAVCSPASPSPCLATEVNLHLPARTSVVLCGASTSPATYERNVRLFS